MTSPDLALRRLLRGTRTGMFPVPGAALAAALVLAAALTLAAACALAVGAPAALAASPGPGWAIQSVALPSDFSAGDTAGCEAKELCDGYLVTVANVGTRPSAGTVAIRDALPEGVVLDRVEQAEDVQTKEEVQCLEEAQTAHEVQCEYANSVAPGDVLAITIFVTVPGHGAAASVTNRAEVQGGGAAPATTSLPLTAPNTVSAGSPPSFGLQDFGISVYGAEGAPDAQAGDRPGMVTATIDYATDLSALASLRYTAVQEPKTMTLDLPLGLVGGPLAAEQCPESDLYGEHCSPDSQIGAAAVDESGHVELVKIYNLVPEAGDPALFAFELDNAPVFLSTRILPSAAGYRLSISVPDIPRPEVVKVTGVTLMLFGDPAERDGETSASTALFTNPSDCAASPSEGAMMARVEMNSWVNPEHWVSLQAPVYRASAAQAVGGCDRLQFDPTIAVAPETTQADTPSGYEVDLKVPQAASVWPVPATPPFRDVEVTLPEGVSISPAAADGLVGCQASGPEGIDLGGADTLEGESAHEVQEGEEPGPDGLPRAARGHCPAASRIGTVEIATPLLREPLEGHLYLAQPRCGRPGQAACTEADAEEGRVFGLYVEAAGAGVVIKLPAEIEAGGYGSHSRAAGLRPGQLRTKLLEDPQLPFSELRLQLQGGPRALLANPQTCGEATAASVLTPWSESPGSQFPATPSSPSQTVGCEASLPLHPGFVAQTATPVAGGFTPFTVELSRTDAEQDLGTIEVSNPPGLETDISAVALCDEPQAAQGACSSASQIGTVTVAAGAGSAPLWLSGPVYLTGPYGGAPFGLSIVLGEDIGPFDLGSEVMRSAIRIDPRTAAVTIASAPLPQIKDGMPLRLQAVSIAIERSGFIVNPTSCQPQQITATIVGEHPIGSDEAPKSAQASMPFAVSGCRELPFKPVFSASTRGPASVRGGGASLTVKVAQKSGEAHIRSVRVELPKRLPARLTTLQRACPQATFTADPASCPAGADIGTAVVDTPVLPVPLEGPVYLVSHGGLRYPELVVVLHGDGVAVDLAGETFIAPRTNLATATFATVPDAPIDSFELSLPERSNSALASPGGDLCGRRLEMPTTITAQNGARVTQTTKVFVSGCPRSRRAKPRAGTHAESRAGGHAGQRAGTHVRKGERRGS
jgi:hypothetical protein